MTYIAMDKTTMDEKVAGGQLLGKQILLLDVETKKQQVIYETSSEEWLVKEVVWDPTGEICAFVTGKQEQDERRGAAQEHQGPLEHEQGADSSALSAAS